jgi:hypothetical protein
VQALRDPDRAAGHRGRGLLFFTLPVTGRESIQYLIAGWLLVIGVGLLVLTWLANRAFFGRKTYLFDPEALTSEYSTRN